jgi:hypothetical protein
MGRFPEPLLHILIDLNVDTVEPSAMLIDVESVPTRIELIEDELLQPIGCSIHAVE